MGYYMRELMRTETGMPEGLMRMSDIQSRRPSAETSEMKLREFLKTAAQVACGWAVVVNI